jgi:tetratricopeptide (TPR) repeat protein
MKRQDYAGALSQADRSLKDFSNGSSAAAAVALKAEALNRLGRVPEADDVVAKFLAQNPKSPVANSMFLTKAAGENSRKDYNAALADYQKVRDNADAGADLQASADGGYIQILQSLGRFDDVINEAKSFAAKYPNNPSLPSVLFNQAMAMNEKHDVPGAIAALQDLAQKYPKSDAAPLALYRVVTINQAAGNLPAMIQAAADLRKAYPDSYDLLGLAADQVGAVLLKQRKFEDAIAVYQPMVDSPKPEVAASARDKIAAAWLASAKAMPPYQSMTVEMRAEAEKRLSSAEQAYVGTLKTFASQPDVLIAVGNAFDGLVNALKQRISWDVLKDSDMEGYLGKLGADLTTPDMQARLELAKAGLVFAMKDGDKQYPAALGRFKAVIAANPELALTRQEANQYGELLLVAKDYPAALKVYTELQTHPDQLSQGDADYGLGATYLGQGDIAQAKTYFGKLSDLTGGGRWQPHYLDAQYGIALANEQSSDAALNAQAGQTYSELMTNPRASAKVQAEAMLGFGRLLEKSGQTVTSTVPDKPNMTAVHYYQQPDALIGPAVAEQSAEGLFYAGQAYEKADNKATAKQMYDKLLANYSTTAPDWADKAKAAEAKLGQ